MTLGDSYCPETEGESHRVPGSCPQSDVLHQSLPGTGRM